jgi:hypothetical protein
MKEDLMGRAKRSSQILDKAVMRADGIRSIGGNIDLGNNLTSDLFTQKIESLRQRLSKYNTLLADLDEALNLLEAEEETLKEAYAQALVGIAAKYGKNSSEYEKAGGVRRVDRKAKARKPKEKGEN